MLSWRPEAAATVPEYAPPPAPITLEEIRALFDSLREEETRRPRLRIEPPADLR